MKRFIGMTILAAALMSTGCSSMGHKGGCCSNGKCSMDKHDAGQKDCCKDGKCDMKDHEHKSEEKK